MTQLSSRWFAACACALCLVLAAPPADARAKSKSRPAKPPAGVSYADGRTADQRERSEDARLLRECRGRPNAGACLGYAR